MADRFADTSGWAALADRSDSHHLQAVEAFEAVWQAGERVVTTNYVLAELTGLFLRLRVSRATQEELFDEIRLDPSVLIVHMNAARDDDAWQLWRARPDKLWTLTDCGSFEVMRQHGLVEAIANDHHFEQAGFVRLLK
ncbi:MAG: PIN domain-containing protein [Gemmataceae bacterium]